MADTQPARFSFSVRDELGTEASTTFYALLDPTSTVGDVFTSGIALGAILDGATAGQIVRFDVALLGSPDAGWKSTPDAGSRVEQTGVFNFANTMSPRHFGEAIPALLSSLIVGGKINLSAGAVSALVNLLTATFGEGVWTNANFQPIVTGSAGLIDAILSFRKRRKQLSRSSFEGG